MGMVGAKKIDRRTQRVTVTSLSVLDRLARKKQMDRDEPDAATPQWQDADGAPIDENTQFSPMIADASAQEIGYFYLPREKGGFTIYSDGACFLTQVSLPHQFKDAEDAAEVCRLLAQNVLSYSLVIEAGQKGKGRNAAALQLYKRNAVRTSSIVDYRNKMRRRQVPLKPAARWDFFMRMIEDNNLTAGELAEAAAYAADIEATRAGDASEYNAEESRGRFLACAAVEE